MMTHREDPEHGNARLEHLYTISKLFTAFENVEQTFDRALAVAAKTLPLRSAILVEAEGDHPRMTTWPSNGQETEQMRAAKAHVQTAYAYFTGSETGAPDEHAGRTALPTPKTATPLSEERRYIVIPLSIAKRPVFGALQLEAVSPIDVADLAFVNAMANQLAVALDRDRARRHDISRREDAEAQRTAAEATGERFEALARENRRLFEEAQQAIRVREQVLAVVSHDLRNPIGSILLATATLARTATPEDRRPGVAQAVTRIERAAHRSKRLIEDLLDFASIEAGRLSIKRATHNPASILHETMANFEAIAQAGGLHLMAEVEPGIPKVLCDRDRILQVFSNLVSNATKVTAPGGSIRLRVESRGDEVVFSVLDTGPGIQGGDAAHLFDRYWRSDEANYKGSGLGLAICRGIVNAHGGQIWAESEPGHGAMFFFTLPKEDAAHLFEPVQPTTSDPSKTEHPPHA